MNKCTKKKPMPSGEDGMKWVHKFKTTYSGTWFKTMECVYCGWVAKASPD